MTQFDARMGFAPALLCIEEEPLKKTAPVAALKPHPKQKEFDAFAKGNHIAGMIAGPSVGVDLASMVAEDISCSIGAYARGHAIHDELTFYTNGQERSRIFRGANDTENKTATEIKLRIDAMQTRIMRTILEDMGVSQSVLKPSGLSGLMDEQRRQEKQMRHALGVGYGKKALEEYTPDGDGWFDGPPPCRGWWEASKSKHEGHYRFWTGIGWSVHVTSRDGNCSNLSPAYDSVANSEKVKWRPFTPPWESTKTLVMFCGRPTIYVPSMDDPLCQKRIKESFSSSSAQARSTMLRMLTKEKCDAASARVNTMLTGDWGDHSPFEKFKPSAGGQPMPANPGLADVNAKLQELSGDTVKFKRFKPQLNTDWPRWGFDPAKADES